MWSELCQTLSIVVLVHLVFYVYDYINDTSISLSYYPTEMHVKNCPKSKRDISKTVEISQTTETTVQDFTTAGNSRNVDKSREVYVNLLISRDYTAVRSTFHFPPP